MAKKTTEKERKEERKEERKKKRKKRKGKESVHSLTKNGKKARTLGNW